MKRIIRAIVRAITDADRKERVAYLERRMAELDFEKEHDVWLEQHPEHKALVDLGQRAASGFEFASSRRGGAVPPTFIRRGSFAQHCCEFEEQLHTGHAAEEV